MHVNLLPSNASREEVIAALIELTPRLTKKVNRLLQLEKVRGKPQRIAQIIQEENDTIIAAYNLVVGIRKEKVDKLAKILNLIFVFGQLKQDKLKIDPIIIDIIEILKDKEENL